MKILSKNQELAQVSARVFLCQSQGKYINPAELEQTEQLNEAILTVNIFIMYK